MLEKYELTRKVTLRVQILKLEGEISAQTELAKEFGVCGEERDSHSEASVHQASGENTGAVENATECIAAEKRV